MGYIFPCTVAIDPAEEARHQEAMRRLGVYDGAWALSKVLEHSDVIAGQRRLLLTGEAVRASQIPEFYPELAELREDGLTVMVVDADGREVEVELRYLDSNKAYRVTGPEWGQLVQETGMASGDRLDFYTCRYGDCHRCLFMFRTQAAGRPVVVSGDRT